MQILRGGLPPNVTSLLQIFGRMLEATDNSVVMRIGDHIEK